MLILIKQKDQPSAKTALSGMWEPQSLHIKDGKNTCSLSSNVAHYCLQSMD